MTRRGGLLVVVAALYVCIGMATAALARGAGTMVGVRVWRFATWFSGLAVFLGHIAYDQRLGSDLARRTARNAAGSVAIAVFILAIVGPVLAHRNSADFWRSAALSVVLWPLLTGIVSFLVALGIASLLRRWRHGSAAPPSAAS